MFRKTPYGVMLTHAVPEADCSVVPNWSMLPLSAATSLGNE